MNSHITPKKIEFIRSLPTKKKGGQVKGFCAEFYQTFKNDLIPILFKIFHKMEAEGKLPNPFSEAIVTLIPKQQRDTTKNT